MEFLSDIKSLARIIIATIILFPVIVYPLLYILQDKLIFIGAQADEATREWAKTQYPDTEVFLETPDHVTLHGWYVNTNPPKKKSPLIIYFGGNAEDVSVNLYDIEEFKGWAVLLINYRGYGLSEGKPSESGLFKDALFLYDVFSQREDVDETRVVVMGRSLGTGVAVYLAAHRDVEGVILVSPYDSIKNVARKAYPFAPVSLLLKHNFDSAALAPSIDVPMLTLIASQDTIIPPSYSEKLIAKWGGEVFRKIIEVRDHNTISIADAYWESIQEFLHLMVIQKKEKGQKE